MGHSGSTLLDCIMGTHQEFQSAGEMRYLNWQLERTKDKEASIKNQDICTCGKNFRNCQFWSRVIQSIKKKTGKNIEADPQSFDIAFFNQFSYQNRGGHKPHFTDRVKAYLIREWLEQGWSLGKILWLEPKIKHWLANNWLLYETMAKVSGKRFVVDSSKHLTIALLLQQYRPDDVTLIFLHRKKEGLISSAGKRASKNGTEYNPKEIIASQKKFESRINKLKKNIRNLNYIDLHYKNIADQPATSLELIVKKVNADPEYILQSDNNFFIDPSQLHLVAGNPMRYRGRQLVKYYGE